MPEEINRVLADHVSTLLLCSSQTAVDNLAAEGITQGVHLIGDVMLDAQNYAVKQAQERSSILTQLGLKTGSYLLATVHRAENTDEETRLRGIFNAFAALEETIVLPLHPRTAKMLQKFNLKPKTRNLKLIEPVGYLDMVMLEKSARIILTDSGGIQKEAYWLNVPCVTLRNETEWPETVAAGWNVIVGADEARIVKTAQGFVRPQTHPPLYGDGQAGWRCCNLLHKAK
jgi:UDP-N-acetylglucosamine 2-epimerase